MYWTAVFLAVALVAAPFAAATDGATALGALAVSTVFVLLAIGSAGGSLITRLRWSEPRESPHCRAH